MIHIVRILCLLMIIALTFVDSVGASPFAPFFRYDFTVIPADHYRFEVNETRHYLQNVLTRLQAQRRKHPNEQIAFIVKQLSDIPYSQTETIGEGDWQPTSTIYKPGAIHINQNPVYRLDRVDCQSFSEIVLALFTSHTINQFDKNFLKIAYGAAGNPHGEIVHYYNRNHFIDGDFNPINQRNGFLIDVTSQGELAMEMKTTAAIITRQHWFLSQLSHLKNIIQVLSPLNGDAMTNRLITTYSHLNYPHFTAEKVILSYLPKTTIALPLTDGSYRPNETLLNKIPTPAIAEIVSDVKHWTVQGVSIKKLIGSELNVSHLGILYRQHYRHGDLIYRKIYCDQDITANAVCHVIPILCGKKNCDELMFAHATKSHPNGFYYYQNPNGHYACTQTLPAYIRHYTRCNRVEQLPLYDYLTEYQYENYWYMNNPAILGIHIEQILSPATKLSFSMR